MEMYRYGKGKVWQGYGKGGTRVLKDSLGYGWGKG